jgi:hypothetical protein
LQLRRNSLKVAFQAWWWRIYSRRSSLSSELHQELLQEGELVPAGIAGASSVAIAKCPPQGVASWISSLERFNSLLGSFSTGDAQAWLQCSDRSCGG